MGQRFYLGFCHDHYVSRMIDSGLSSNKMPFLGLGSLSFSLLCSWLNLSTTSRKSWRFGWLGRRFILYFLSQEVSRYRVCLWRSIRAVTGASLLFWSRCASVTPLFPFVISFRGPCVGRLRAGRRGVQFSVSSAGHPDGILFLHRSIMVGFCIANISICSTLLELHYGNNSTINP